jgi:hypothetical protein
MTRTSFVLCMLALAACVPAATTTAPATISDSPNAGPGITPVTTDLAAETFRAACVATKPSFSTAPAVLRSRGFAQNTRTTTFYNPTYNLSVKLIPESGGGVCSMVFGSKDSPAVLAANLTAAGGPGTAFQPSGASQGQTYYRVAIEAGN